MVDDELPPLTKNYDSDNSANDDDWEEMETKENDFDELTKCLFCVKDFNSVELAIEHLKNSHSVDFSKLKVKFNMEQYSFIKMINFIRKNKSSEIKFQDPESIFWDDEIYLKPEGFEPWLTFDYEELIGSTTTNSSDNSELHQIIEKLNKQLVDKNLQLEQAVEDIEKMKKTFHNLVEKTETKTKQLNSDGTEQECVGNLSLEDDEGYFNSYSHFGIHHDMLSDAVRTDSYRDAILKNSKTLKDKIVLDLGCGTSILSMFASRAGAKEVISIDQSDIIYQAMDIVRKNNITNIKFVKGRLEDTEIPHEKVDCIISEWMGYFLLFEGMLDSVIYARDRHLKEDGILMPNRCNMSIVGLGDEVRHKQLIDFWSNVYGFDMSCMQKEVLRDATTEIVNGNCVLTEPNIVADFDLMKIDLNYPNFTYNLNLSVKKDGKLTAFVGYFDTFFELPEKVEFSTSPNSIPTHWKQVSFFIKDPIDVKAGDVISGKFTCQRDRKDVRSIFITFEVFGMILKYNLH